MNVWGLTKKILGIGLLCLPLTMSTTLTGCLTEDDGTDSTPDTNKTALAASKTISVGGQGHSTLGSVLELDAGVALLSAAANAAQDNIDLVLLFYSGGWHLENAVMAKASGVTHSINLTNGYDDTKIKDIKVVKLSAAPANQEDAKAKFTAGTNIKGSVVTGGEIFVIQTTGGKIAVVTVKSVSGTDNKGAADVTLSTLTIP